MRFLCVFPWNDTWILLAYFLNENITQHHWNYDYYRLKQWVHMHNMFQWIFMVTITSHISINIFQTVHFSAVKFTRDSEKNMNFLLIPKLCKVWKNLKQSDRAPLNKTYPSSTIFTHSMPYETGLELYAKRLGRVTSQTENHPCIKTGYLVTQQ